MNNNPSRLVSLSSFYFHRYLIFFKALGLLIIFPAFSANAQWNTGGEIENTRVNFGFILGINANTFTIIKVKNFNTYTLQSGTPTTGTPSVTSGKLKYINTNFTPGFHLGLLANFKINDNLDLRFTPDVNFSDRTLSYAYDSISSTTLAGTASPDIQKTVQSTYLDFPLLLKFKSDRKGNIRSYIIGGLQYSYDIIPKKKTDDAGFDPIQKLVKLQPNSISYKIGIGLDLYYEYFKMSPEISVTNGLNDILKQDNNPFSSPIQRLIPTSIQFSLYFE